MTAEQTAEAQTRVRVPSREADAEEVVFRERVELDSAVMSVSADGVLLTSSKKAEKWSRSPVSPLSPQASRYRQPMPREKE